MKHKLLLGCILSSLLSANSFALDIHGGKLISHKEWTKGSVIKSSFKEVAPSKKLNVLDQNTQNSFDWITAHGITYTAGSFLEQIKSIPVNTDIEFNGYGEASISNGTNAQATYTIHTSLDVTPPCNSMLCPVISKVVEDVVVLDPSGYITTGRSIGMTTSFALTGRASYETRMTVSNDSKATIFNTSGDTLYIQVTDQKK